MLFRSGNSYGVAAKGYGNTSTGNNVANYSYSNGFGKNNSGSGAVNGFGKSAESFLNSLNNKRANEGADISKYKEGQRIYHKKFGEGTINKIEEEGEDYKLDISFDKVGHKRLMAKFANLEII